MDRNVYLASSGILLSGENMDTIVYDAVQDVKAVAEYNGGA